MAIEQQQPTKKINCGYCQAEVEIPPFASVVTCPYCGTPNELRTGKIIQNHHMLSVYFSGSELTELIPEYLSKYVGVPSDFADKVIFTDFELRMMPFWVFKFHGHTDYTGLGKYCPAVHSTHWSRSINIQTRPERGSIDLDQTCLVFGYREQHKEIRDEKIPVGSKEAFDINAVNAEGGRIYDTEIGYDEAYRNAEEQVKKRHNELIYREIYKIEGLNQKIDLKEVSYLHVPFYRITYKYGNWTGEALVDAARGKVLRAEYPISRSHRFWGFTFILLALGVIGGAIFAALQTALSEWGLAGIVAAVIFAGVLIFGIKETVTKKKVAAE
ncbi:MAG: phage holin family protein [Candidatus Heimdallarchaeota archaeon]|nr:hypothetical protein [Candidatus Heimdallarchaeota archaeon]RLI67989.1 MAG: hypothetical protein DRO63_03540 [Candidatus Gerdarchaeota archaeon]RLI71278.1 MAG: hypothetical protein DRP02_05325 [Candidatus Gerdarchaeota archaeon]RLI74328.1 MAG: hypothetical protein DRO91_00750 [Candidatus Heimdallarchaeota archaeon]